MSTEVRKISNRDEYLRTAQENTIDESHPGQFEKLIVESAIVSLGKSTTVLKLNRRRDGLVLST